MPTWGRWRDGDKPLTSTQVFRSERKVAGFLFLKRVGVKMSQYFRVNKSHTKYNTITSEGDNGLKGLVPISVCTLMIESELIPVTCGPLA